MSAASNNKPETPIVLSAPYSKVHIIEADVLDHAMMRSRQLAALLIAMQPEEGPSHLLWLAQQIADEVVGVVASIVGVAQ